MIIDTHCHYNISPIWDDANPQSWQTHWQKANNCGVGGSIVVGVNAQTSEIAVQIANSDSRLLAAVGFHPTDDVPDSAHITNLVTEKTLVDIEQTIRKLCSTNQVAAIGEVGLDYFRLPEDSTQATAIIEHQKAICSLQLKLAAELNLPVLLHVRDVPGRSDAYDTMLHLLKTQASMQQPFVLHCVSGPISYIQDAVQLGGFIGVAGNITYRSAQHIRDIVTAVPKDRILLETDAPFLAPQNFRGSSCEPWMITKTAEYMQSELAVDLAQVLANTVHLFPQLAAAASQETTVPLQ